MKRIIAASLFALAFCATAQAETAVFPQRGIEWLKEQRRGNDQLSRDFYWNDFVRRYPGDTSTTCDHPLSGDAKTCFTTMQHAVRGIPGIETLSILVILDRASRQATRRTICFSMADPKKTRCIDWDTGAMLIPHPVQRPGYRDIPGLFVQPLDYKFEPAEEPHN
jgi:hypothetical protein